VDELGYLPLDQASGNWIFEVVSRRYEKGSIIVTSNRGFSDAGRVLAESVVAAAIVARPLHSAMVVNIRGRSYRMRAHQAPPEGKTVDDEVAAGKRRATKPRTPELTDRVPRHIRGHRLASMRPRRQPLLGAR